jgi:hypothetical protein
MEASKRFTVVITFRKSIKISPVLQQMLKLLPSWPNALSIPADHIVYSLEFLLGNCWNLTACTHRTPNTNFFSMKRWSSWTSPGFSALQYRLFWEFTSPRKENQDSLEKITNCGSTCPSYTDWRNQLQKCIFATGTCSFKAWSTNILHAHSCNSFVAFRPDVF